jgi:hypothetical protein
VIVSTNADLSADPGIQVDGLLKNPIRLRALLRVVCSMAWQALLVPTVFPIYHLAKSFFTI